MTPQAESHLHELLAEFHRDLARLIADGRMSCARANMLTSAIADLRKILERL